jgi:isocitrate dehydrogenase kinase/phosphatase
MDIPVGQNPVAAGIAAALIDGFDKHYWLFRELSCQAKQRFENADWTGVQRAVRERIRFYDERVAECVERLRSEFGAETIDVNTWQQAKLLFIARLINHKQPELAETFFNSVTCKILHRSYFHNDFLFFRPAVSTEFIESEPLTYRSYYPNEQGMRNVVGQFLLDMHWTRPFADLDRDVGLILRMVTDQIGAWPAPEANCQVRVLHSPFYRNKAAYVIGKTVNGNVEHPFAIPVLHDPEGRLVVDTVILDAWRISILFSLSRAYFMVDMEVPSAYVKFLRSIMPTKPRSELYTMLGLGKQGKTMFYRDLHNHLRHTHDLFVEAPGIRGLVMHVFTLPSFPYVFKLIKDAFGGPKETDRPTVMKKFLMVKQVNRVGRIADTLEFTDLVLPKARFTPALLDELRRVAASLVEEEEGNIVIRHCYVERRMTPLNMYLEGADDERIDHAVFEYGNAIRELASANIFPGDLLWKNFGVTRYGRVVFYDYDEIELLTDCNFRRIPPAPDPETEMSGEVWYPVARNDIFPEEFGPFLLGVPAVRKAFMKYHQDLLKPEFWQQVQQRIRDGEVIDFYPYPESLRFCQRYPEAGARIHPAAEAFAPPPAALARVV